MLLIVKNLQNVNLQTHKHYHKILYFNKIIIYINDIKGKFHDWYDKLIINISLF